MKILTQQEVAQRYKEILQRITIAFDKCEGIRRNTPEEVVISCIKRDDYLMFEDNDTIAILCIEDRGVKVLNIIALEGKLSDFKDNYQNIEKFARHMNCKFIEATGRRGWLKMLKDWKVETVYSKELK